ncbi:MAG: hypothetical protein WKG06_05555 [Segetibacter sp.]
MEVWVTNRTGATTETRDVVGFMDLGEGKPYDSTRITGLGAGTLPDNGANTLYNSLISNPNIRNPVLINSILRGQGFNPVEDYEKTFARKLSPNEYFFNPQIGFVSLSQQLQPDEVLGVAYQYSLNGKIYQVGEFSQDVTLDFYSGGTKGFVAETFKSNFAASQASYMEMDDEECIFP